MKWFCGPCQLNEASECVPQGPGKKHAIACLACAEKKVSCHPPAKWAEKRPAIVGNPSQSTPKPAPKSGRVRSTTCMSEIIFRFNLFIASPPVKDNIMPLLQQIQSTIQADGHEIRDRLYNVETMIRAMCAQIKIQPSSLPLRIPAVPAFSAPSPSTSTISTSTTSAISSASSSSAVHVPRMSFGAPQSAGPSRPGKSSVQREFPQFLRYL